MVSVVRKQKPNRSIDERSEGGERDFGLLNVVRATIMKCIHRPNFDHVPGNALHVRLQTIFVMRMVFKSDERA